MENKVSIIIPTYNRVNLLRETLISIVNQTYTNWECIIIDDGSTDNTVSFLKEFSKQDNRIKHYKRPKELIKGANSSRNYGFSKAVGQYIKFFDSDDLMKPVFLENQVDLLDEKKELDFCVCLSETFVEGTKEVYINKANRNITHDILTSYLTKNHYFLTGAPLWKKEFLKKQEYLFDENLKNSDESDFHFRVLLNLPNYIYTDDVLYSVRRGNESSITQDEKNKESSLISQFIFFYKVFKKIKSKTIKNKKPLINYVFSRLLTNLYHRRQIRLNNILVKDFLLVLNCLFKINTHFINKMKLFLGLLSLILTSRGHRLLKMENIERRECIEN